jgi:hypothetical protein
MFRSVKLRRALIAMLLAVGAIAGFAATAHAGSGSDLATCLPFRPGCDM